MLISGKYSVKHNILHIPVYIYIQKINTFTPIRHIFIL